jgi:nucleolysin TIA-1/TIAR
VNSKGFNYGFVEYDDPGAAERGMATLNGRRIHNNVSANTETGVGGRKV